ncbi:hypothetical conserved protein [Candidatus Nitrosoglobus terrae]|uniref:Hypothetical conserved protein n=1 Tax=Candidatus Nitrosoglobus terrae TaxID=1630141 RepID=A0A1Q2SPE0_9GAMM|nr:hypothetical protein [Candidatus Nitrosoglobus terrae]BAW81004.1 hypothetical conserved protein [Candidatus Nitrosoglobus terrae]
MKTQSLSISGWMLIVTILWIGFLLTISSLESPLKSSATLPTLFRIQLIVEILFTVFIILAAYFGKIPRNTRVLITIIAITLILQLVLLFAILNENMNHGSEALASPYHIVHVVIAGQIIRAVTLPSYPIMYMMIKNLKLLILTILAFRLYSELRSGKSTPRDPENSTYIQ